MTEATITAKNSVPENLAFDIVNPSALALVNRNASVKVGAAYS